MLSVTAIKSVPCPAEQKPVKPHLVKWHLQRSKLCTVLNFSAGVQSSTLLHMLVKGDIPRPYNLLVLNANPGMENSGTYEYLDYMRHLCDAVDIHIYTVPGPNLLEDILTNKAKTRLDNPPYYVKKPNGTRGRLLQKCTQAYKIAPMDRFLRRYIESKWGKGGMAEQGVHKWIGFAVDEINRISEPKQRYVRFVYPLVELRMTKQDCLDYLNRHRLKIPPRSVCNACFANNLATLKEMYEHRPNDWKQAVAVDEAMRDSRHLGIENPVYVSSTLVPLKDLPPVNFKPGEEAADECAHPGVCFL